MGKSAYLTINGLRVLHSLEMPSFLAEAPAHQVAGLYPHDKRSSFDRQSQASDRIDGHDPRSHDPDQKPNGNIVENAPNGISTNGSTNPVFSRPNGQAMDAAAPPSKETMIPQRPPDDQSSHVATTVTGKSRATEDNNGTSRVATRDDGYFATIHAAETEERFWETHVKLDAVNGNVEIREQGNDGHVVTREDNVLQTDTVYTSPTKMSPVERSNAAELDAAPRLPSQLHRISSPPALQKDNSNALVLHPSIRSSQRHTLEVPRVATSRLSRESPNRSDLAEVISASGRVTPSTPTRRRGSVTLVRRATRSLHSDMHLDDIPQDEDAARWTEMVRQKRMSKRKRKEEEDEDRVVMGTKVDQNHVNYVTAYNMLTGIRFTVSRTNAKLDRDLTDADFEAKHKFSFDV